MEIQSLKKALVSLNKPEKPTQEARRPHPVLLRGGEDCRSCVLCRKKGDGLAGDMGRLLPMGVDSWIHLNCARVCYPFLGLFLLTQSVLVVLWC